ncbi:putative uncharacterized protein precursor [Thermotoga petrophila RKU-10]|uniref:Uncharacterized protein n=1 Tax=Thermotoga petrophila (strain ATCC BAA-489 / DSM 13996 / JCM 10882 / RKU-10) TaxID=590168 RepID=D2C4R4_THEP2|nr:hypothetical protein [Thermotoga petrophila]ADA67718.1 putative uncharacterized protein precursor [Thermotoga petrophila RKU-10]
MKWSLMIFLILAVATVFSEPMIMYQFVMAEVKESTGTGVSLEELYLSTDESNEGSIHYSSDTVELKLFPLSIKVKFPVIRDSYRILSKPWILTVLGKSAVVRVGREEILTVTQGMTTVQEMYLSITPQQLDKQSVLSDIEMKLDGAHLRTKLWISQEDFQPIAYSKFKTDEKEHRMIVFCRALVVEKPPEEKVFVAGNVSGLEEFMGKEEEKPEESFILLSSYPEARISLWLNKNIHFSASFPDGLLIETKLFGEELKLGAIYWRFRYLGVGFSDRTSVGNLSLSAGVYALFDLTKFSGILWWGRGDLKLSRFSVSLSFRSHWTLEETPWEVSLSAGYDLSKNITVLLGASYDSTNYKIFVGVRYSF